MKTGKKVLFFIVGLLLIALGALLITQAIYLGNLDHTLQIAQNGFYKDDVTVLSFGQRAAQITCWIGGVLSALFGVGSILAVYGVIGF